MRTIRIKLYKFSELSKEAKNKAIEKMYYLNVAHDWSELTLDQWEEKLNRLGFNDVKIYFSGFSSQGDGACFICESIDFTKFLKGKYKGLDITANITHSWMYYFATSTTVNLSAPDDNLFSEIEKSIETEREKLGNEIYKILEKEYDYLTSEAAIIESIKANEYEFEKDGTLH